MTDAGGRETEDNGGDRQIPVPGEIEVPPQDALMSLVEATAHDVNNLMGGILAISASVRNELGEDHHCEPMLQSLEQAAEKAGQLIQKLNATVDGSERKIEAVNLNPIVCRVLLVEEQELAPRVRIVRHVDPDLWDAAGDTTQLTHVILNLALNAVESIKEEGRVVFRTRNITMTDEFVPKGSGLKPGRFVYLSAEVKGCHISPEELAHVFDGAYGEGSNHQFLGLDRVQRTIKRYGGFISAIGEEGWGVTFHLFIPAFETTAPKKAVRWNNLPRGHETILIIDDNQMILDVTQEVLSHLGYRTLTAGNGHEAVELAKTFEGDIHLSLLDQVMPVMSGAEACPLLKQARPDMKVVICTGFERELSTKGLMSAGADSFLLKPFPLSKLANEIRRVLDGAPVPQKPALA